MAGDKYLRHDGQGGSQEQNAVQTSAGATNAGNIPALDSTGHFDLTLFPTGIGADTQSIIASENLAAGDLVSIWANGSVTNIRKADASGGTAKQADGFVKTAVASGVAGVVYSVGSNDAASGMTVGKQFLSGTTPGKSTTTPPTTSGYIVQRVGVAITATVLTVELKSPITLA